MARAPIDLDDLRAVPLLARLDEDDLVALRDQTRARRLRKGEVLWRAGDAGDELLVVLSGELEVLGADGAGGEELIARLGPGEHVGELALLLGERRSATVACSVPGTVLAISGEAFDSVVKDDRALAVLSEVVARRAVERLRRRPVTARLRVVAVVGERGADPADVASVADAIATRTSTLVGRDAVLVPRAAFWDRSGTAGRPQRSQNEVVAGVAGLRVEHAGRDLCVLDLGTMPVEAAAACCDVVVRVTDEPHRHDDPSVLTVVTGPRTAEVPAACDPFILSTTSATTTTASLDRLVRKLFGVTVGLALGGGAAFGIAHVGVIQALQHAGIDVDLYAGTSFGSIVAIGSAAGLSGDDMAAIAARIGNLRTTLSVLDPAADGSGLLAGRRLVKIFAPLLRHERFDELTKPCRVVATDIESGERVAIGAGRLDDAFRASCSIPIVFSPVVRDGCTLVDGAMVDPVPAEVVREMGADIVIAVNVVPRLEKGATTSLSRVFKTVNRFNPMARRAGTSSLPGLVDVLMNSLQVVQYELGRFRSIAADVPIEVDLAGFTWIDFPKATQLVARGRDAGRDAVPLVQAAVANRSGAGGDLDEQRELVGER